MLCLIRVIEEKWDRIHENDKMGMRVSIKLLSWKKFQKESKYMVKKSKLQTLNTLKYSEASFVAKKVTLELTNGMIQFQRKVIVSIAR